MIPLGNLIAGAVSSMVGLRPTLLGMSVVGVAAALLVLAVPGVRRLPRATPV